DALLADIAECIAAQAPELAAQAVADTGLGNVPDKTRKNVIASRGIYQLLNGQPGTGRLSTSGGVLELASPMGVIFVLVPRTHPVATFVFKVLIALKGRNALIVSSDRAAQNVTNTTGDLIAAVLEQHKAPL